MPNKTIAELFDDLADKGGAIVSSDACSMIEIQDAQNTGRWCVLDSGLAFVRREQRWLESREQAYHDGQDNVAYLREAAQSEGSMPMNADSLEYAADVLEAREADKPEQKQAEVSP